MIYWHGFGWAKKGDERDAVERPRRVRVRDAEQIHDGRKDIMRHGWHVDLPIAMDAAGPLNNPCVGIKPHRQMPSDPAMADGVSSSVKLCKERGYHAI